MSCKVDGKSCDGDGKVCRLNPDDKEPFFYDDTDGRKHVFYNRFCSNFRKVE